MFLREMRLPQRNVDSYSYYNRDFFGGRVFDFYFIKILYKILLYKNFYTIFKGYFPLTVITNYWLYSLCCAIHP